MLTKSYKQYISSAKWSDKREQYFLSRGKWCRACKSQRNIKLHHLSYDNFGNEPLSDLVSLCNPCHVEVHRLHRRAGRQVSIREVTLQYIREKTLQRLRRKTPRRLN